MIDFARPSQDGMTYREHVNGAVTHLALGRAAITEARGHLEDGQRDDAKEGSVLIRPAS